MERQYTYEEIMAKMPETARRHIESVHQEIGRLKEQGGYDTLIRERKDGQRGYIICLRDCGYINDVDFRRLIIKYVQRW